MTGISTEDLIKITLDNWEGELSHLSKNAAITIVDKDGKIIDEIHQVLEIGDVKNLIDNEIQSNKLKSPQGFGRIKLWD